LIEGKRVVAIIPARGGSKGIPRKNIKNLNGKPLIAYTIEEALNSKYVDRVILSTEDLEIAEISKTFGAEVPFLRPKELAQDDTPGIEPIIHAINYLLYDENYNFDYVMCLQCTSPLRNSKQIDQGIYDIYTKDAYSAVSVCESEVNPYWMKVIKNGKMVDYLSDNKFYARRQDLPVVYRLNGAIYIAKVEIILNNKNWYTNNTIPIVMDKFTSIDIDDEIDFKFAEFLLNQGVDNYGNII